MNHSSPSQCAVHLRLLVWSLVAGVASGSLSLLAADVVPVIKGAVLALLLSLGVVVLNRSTRSRLVAEKPAPIRAVAWTALGSGLAAGLALMLINAVSSALQTHPPEIALPPLTSGWGVLVMGICYGLAAHLTYALRWRLKSGRALKTLFLLALAGWCCGIVRAWLAVDVWKGDRAWELAWGLALFSGLPFAAFWAVAVMGCDPAWTLERWQRATQPANIATASGLRRPVGPGRTPGPS